MVAVSTNLPKVLTSRGILVVIFLLALVFRLSVVTAIGKAPYKDQIWNDSVGWNLAQGIGYTASLHPPYVPGLYRTPAFPALLAVAYRIAGHSYKAGFAAQSVVDALTALLVYAIAGLLFGPLVALIAGFAYAIYPYPAAFCGILTQDILLTFAVTATLYLLLRALKRPESLLAWSYVGVGLGGIALVKPFLGLFAVVCVASVYFHPMRWAMRVKAVAAMALVSFATILPWGIRNWVVFHAVPPLAAGATGSALPLIAREVREGDAQYVAGLGPAYAETPEEYLRNFADGEALLKVEKGSGVEGVNELKQMWGRYLLVMAWHFPRLWMSVYAVHDTKIVAIIAFLLSFLVLVPGLAGIYLHAKRWRELFPLLATLFWVTLIYVPITMEARYSLPARPAMIVFVAAALAAVVEWWLRRSAPGSTMDSSANAAGA